MSTTRIARRLAPRLISVLVLSVISILIPTPASAQSTSSTAAGIESDGGDPWAKLAELRRSLAGDSQAASFVQTFIPANFSSGESENGTIGIALPDCLRWDYSEPYPKSFLLCGDMFYTWNTEDRRGRRASVDRQEEPGLDLLLFDGETLSKRYEASLEGSTGSSEPSADSTDGGWTLTLRPRSDQLNTAALVRATFVVAGDPLRLVELSYEDSEGNTTRFKIGDYRPLAAAGAFVPPTDIEWEDL